MRRFSALAATAILAASPAFAGCPAGTTPILSCSFQGGAKVVTACQDDATATYAFGKAGQAPDLALSTPIADLAYTPWPGIGRSIWAQTAFENQGVTYLLWFNYDKLDAIDDAQAAGAPDPLTAGIIVLRGEEELTHLDCDAGSIQTEMEALYEVKERLGQCWDQGAQLWAMCE
ncbi:MAG TPA: hypothetical protein ENK83_02960 [Aliiroseovarius sp.]|nr:hypothetical protein [Aliiroseovarius sp.]